VIYWPPLLQSRIFLPDLLELVTAYLVRLDPAAHRSPSGRRPYSRLAALIGETRLMIAWAHLIAARTRGSGMDMAGRGSGGWFGPLNLADCPAVGAYSRLKGDIR